jgi:hypothetical protein
VATAPDETASSGSIAPEDSFLVQIRGGSRLADCAVSGRIEHLHSAISEPFGSLAELVDFLDRHFGKSGSQGGSTPPEPDEDDPIPRR